MQVMLTSAQMRAAEQVFIEGGGATGSDLMARAGQGVVDAVLANWPDLAVRQGRAAVYCGPGNNGGDGFVTARLLVARGWQVAVWMWGDPARLPPDARAAYDDWAKVGQVSFARGAAEQVFPGFWDEPPDLIIDAILGTGLTRDLDREIAQAIAEIQHYKERRKIHPPTLAIDIPSGLCADSGRNRGNRCLYDLTVTFHTAKPGHYLDEGPMRCGALEVIDIGLPKPADFARLPADVAHLVTAPGPVLKQAGHKFDHGHAVVLSGGVGRGGAARLAARGALRVGAGLVTLACPPAALIENAAHLTAVMLRPLKDGAALTEWLHGDPRISALSLGPGLGTGARAQGLVAAALRARRPTVLDADALTLLARDPDLAALLHKGCLLTPHGGEFARLCPDLARRLSQEPGPGPGPAYSKLDATRAAAARLGCTVLLKGPDTVIANPDGVAVIHAAAYDRAAPWLATAGAGDVLSGLAAGLLARGFSPADAARSAAWLHVESARRFGPGLIAEDLSEILPAVLSTL